MKCHGEGGACRLKPKCEHACTLRIQYIAGRDDCMSEWADHMKRMAASLKAPEKAGDLQVKDTIWKAVQAMRKAIEQAQRLGYGGNMLSLMEDSKAGLHHIIKELS